MLFLSVLSFLKSLLKENKLYGTERDYDNFLPPPQTHRQHPGPCSQRPDESVLWQVSDWVMAVSLLNHQLVILNSLQPRLPICKAEEVSQGFGCSDDETEGGEYSKLSSEVSHVALAVGDPKVLREAITPKVALQWLPWCHRAELCRALPPTSLLGSFWLWEGEKLGDRTENWPVVTSPFPSCGIS